MTPPAQRPPPGSGRRVPGWMVPVLGGLAGWVAANWLGAIFGVIVGTLVWRSR